MKSMSNRMEKLLDEYAKLNLLNPTKFPSYKEFTGKWTAPNPEQEENRFNRNNDKE